MSKAWAFNGIIPALPTPFRNGSCDLESFERLIRYLLEAKVHGVVVCGSTGEGMTVNDSEYAALMQTARQVIGKKIPIIAGVGSNCTQATVARSRQAAEWGADGLLVVTPYYNKPPQEGLYQHYRTVATSTNLPIILYNVPGRTACNMLPETVARLCEFKNIVAIKEASGSLPQAMEIIARCGDRLQLISGEDVLLLPLLSIGGDGIISVFANLVPHELVEAYNAFKQGQLQCAQELIYQTRSLAEAVFWESNPIPLKAALHDIGMFDSDEVRSPLCAMSPVNRVKLKKLVVEELGLAQRIAVWRRKQAA